jgi:hypothetical protein
MNDCYLYARKLVLIHMYQYYVVSHECKDNVTLAEEKLQNRLSK